MKKYVLILVLSFITVAAIAQTHRVTVYTTVGTTGSATYPGSKFFPDSIKTSVFINYRKVHKARNAAQAILLMNLDGWKMLSYSIYNSEDYYFLSREITLDDNAYKLYVANLTGGK
jgi:CRISPR/Cas system-associated exonuclease Cas4 (RecB family)